MDIEARQPYSSDLTDVEPDILGTVVATTCGGGSTPQNQFS